MFTRLRFPAMVFFATTLLGLLPVHYAIGGPGWLLAGGTLAYGLILGFLVQLCIRQPLPRLRVAVGAFFGVFTLWLPIVVVTYGFALLASPAFFAYSFAVVAGSYLSLLLTKARSINNAA
jgi:hypothetical protein